MERGKKEMKTSSEGSGKQLTERGGRGREVKEGGGSKLLEREDI